ncbi:zeta toxin family protein [Sinorhizobium fredii]|uniref:zeta toxin family protein n=1 Tax=Rhizobium fredii TaxID=380 RepID=UPI003514D0BC
MSSGEGSPASLELPDRLALQIYQEKIIPRLGVGGPPLERPTFVIVGGQQGSGKTTTLRQVAARFGDQPTQRIIVDDLMGYVPGYHEAARKNSHEAQRQVGSTPGQWGWQLMDRAIERRANVVLELAFPVAIADLAMIAKSNGYKTELHVIATDRRESWTAVLDRFDRALKAGDVEARIVGRSEHENAYSRWPSAVLETENRRDIDRIEITRRDGTVIYSNQLIAKNGRYEWEGPSRAFETLILERNRAVSMDDAKRINAVWDRLVSSPELVREPSLDIPQLAVDRLRIRQFHESEGSRFDIFKAKPENTPKAASEWVGNFVEDMRRVKEGNLQTDAHGFEQRFTGLVQTMKTRVESNLRESVSIAVESRQTSPGDREQQQTQSVERKPELSRSR